MVSDRIPRTHLLEKTFKISLFSRVNWDTNRVNWDTNRVQLHDNVGMWYIDGCKKVELAEAEVHRRRKCNGTSVFLGQFATEA